MTLEDTYRSEEHLSTLTGMAVEDTDFKEKQLRTLTAVMHS